MPPLYKVSKKNGKHEDSLYAWDDDELEDAKKKKQKKRQKRIDKIKGKRHNSSIKKTLTKASEIRKGF